MVISAQYCNDNDLRKLKQKTFATFEVYLYIFLFISLYFSYLYQHLYQYIITILYYINIYSFEKKTRKNLSFPEDSLHLVPITICIVIIVQNIYNYNWQTLFALFKSEINDKNEKISIQLILIFQI